MTKTKSNWDEGSGLAAPLPSDLGSGEAPELAIASGKGGTGKTSVVLSLASVASKFGPVEVLDCDVEAPNCHLFLKPNIAEVSEIRVLVPEVDDARCTHCGLCQEVCAFHAMLSGPRGVLVLPELCHSCSACSYLCPEKCIAEIPRAIGEIREGTATVGHDRIDLIYGLLTPGEVLATPLIGEVHRRKGKGVLTIVDSPPGTTCTMVESVRNADFCILVTEPTPFGLHDLRLAHDVTKKLGVPSAVVINRSDVGTSPIEDFCDEQGIAVVGRIPFDREFGRIHAEGGIAAMDGPFEELFLRIYDDVKREIARTTAEGKRGT